MKTTPLLRDVFTGESGGSLLEHLGDLPNKVSENQVVLIERLDG